MLNRFMGVLILRAWGRPRILRVRMGFNANSSSLAAFVTYFLWGSTAVVLLTNLVAAAIFAKDHKDPEPTDGRTNRQV